jgi:hypothetical protein
MDIVYGNKPDSEDNLKKKKTQKRAFSFSPTEILCAMNNALMGCDSGLS